MPSPSDASFPVAGLTVRGTLPAGLSGQYVVVAQSPAPMVHTVALNGGSSAGHRCHALGTETSSAQIFVFGQRIFAVRSGGLAIELDATLTTIGNVDLAGRGRSIGAHPQVDPETGDLHLVSYAHEVAHHVISSNFQTRTTRPIAGAPERLVDLLLTRDRLVLIGEGTVGIVGRSGDAHPRWIDTRLKGAVAAYGPAVVVLATETSLVRWRFGATGETRSDVLDDTPQRVGQVNPRLGGACPRYLWSTAAAGRTEIYRHDLRVGSRTTRDLGVGHQPGPFTFVEDPTRSVRQDGGWLVGFVVDTSAGETDLVVLDASAIDRPTVASIRVPARIASESPGTWIPASTTTASPRKEA